MVCPWVRWVREGTVWTSAVSAFVTIALVLRISLVRTAAWTAFLKLIGVSRAERRRLGIAAARRDLDVRDPPAT
jgi:hypothetical protein